MHRSNNVAPRNNLKQKRFKKDDMPTKLPEGNRERIPGKESARKDTKKIPPNTDNRGKGSYNKPSASGRDNKGY